MPTTEFREAADKPVNGGAAVKPGRNATGKESELDEEDSTAAVVEAKNPLLIILGAEWADDGAARTDVIESFSHLLSGKTF